MHQHKLPPHIETSWRTPVTFDPTSGTCSYRAVNRKGTIVRTFGDLETAVKWVELHYAEHDTLAVEEVITFTNVGKVYCPTLKIGLSQVDNVIPLPSPEIHALLGLPAPSGDA